MRRRSAILLCAALVLTSCWSSRPHYVIGVSQCSDDAWRQKMNSEMQTEVLLYDNIVVEITSAGDDNARQIADIRSFIDRKVDLLIVAPNEAVPITPVVEEAYSKNIPVIVVDRKILSDKYTAYIGADNYQIGRAVGEYIAARLRGSGKVIELAGLSGSTPAIDRHQGFVSALKRYSGIELLCSEDARWLQESAEQKADSLFWYYPDVDILFAHNDRMAYGAYLSAQRLMRADRTDFVGIDALPGPDNGLGLVRKGVLDATFIYPTGGDKVITTAMNILQGKPFARETLLNTAIVDSTNAAILEMQTVQIQEQQQKIDLFKSRVNTYLLRYSTQLTISWFSIVCLLLIVAILLLVWRSFRAKSRMNRELIRRNDEITSQKEQLECQRDQLIELSRQLEEATQAKLVFFTNISHDFRTPLTLIADPVEQLLLDPAQSEQARFYLGLVRKNVQILLRMVSQILDFRKYENGKLELNCSQLDLAECLRTWNTLFLPLAERKRIGFECTLCPDIDFRIAADGEKMERVYYNLLSNALKFTTPGGNIRVELTRIENPEGSFLRLTVSNSGSFVDAVQARLIFDRFYQADRTGGGSGIGLALCKVFVEMHGGTIGVDSSHEGGTTFTVLLPAGEPETGAPEDPVVPVTEMFVEEFGAPVVWSYDQTRISILVIDDNPDILAYLARLLGARFAVIGASDGEEGIRQAMAYVPDLIISDVMMPGMDGIECCQHLKRQISTCHIPVLLLTACSLDEQRIEGLNSGADSYLAKPFNAEVLTATVNSLLENRAKLKHHYTDNQPMAIGEGNEMDRDFISRIQRLVEQHIDDPAFSVEEIGRMIGMSRVQLYRKLKALTSLSPNEYVRIVRLKRAATLLATTDRTVAEVAYEVGFSSPSYFSKCYREQYGETPVDYQRRVRK